MLTCVDERFVQDGSQLTGFFRENFLAVGRIGGLRKIAARASNGPEFRNGLMQL